MAFITLLTDMQTFPLPDVLEDLCSPANLRYQARSLLAQMDKRGIGTLSFVRASSEPVMMNAGQPVCRYRSNREEIIKSGVGRRESGKENS